MEGKTNFSRRLAAYRLSETGFAECLEIIDIRHDLKEFDGLTLTSKFYDRSKPLHADKTGSRIQSQSVLNTARV